MRILSLLAVILLLLPILASASVIYNDPEVFWVRNHAAFFTDPATNQQVRVQRISNDQLRIYLQNDGVRTQLGLPVLEKKAATQTLSTGPITLQQPYVAQKEIDRNTYKPLQGPGPTPLDRKESTYTHSPLTHSPRIRSGYDETEWVYQNTQYIQDRAMHRNYNSNYYGDQNLYDMLNNQRIRYQPYGQAKYYE